MSTFIVGDIGGTNGRFALSDGQVLSQFKRFSCIEYASFEQMLDQYLDFINGAKPKAAMFVIATHVSADYVQFTNQPWAFSINDIAKRYHFSFLKVINDFTAVSIAIPLLGAQQLVQIGGEMPKHLIAAKAVIGPGTGLGVSGLLPHEDGWVPVQGQGGHVSIQPGNDYEKHLFKVIVGRLHEHSCAYNKTNKKTHCEYPYVSAENLLSGSGLLLLYIAVATVANSQIKNYTPADIVEAGLTQKDADCEQVLKIFCGLLGEVAGDLVLSLGARSGVYIGGGIVSHITTFLSETTFFRERFENKGCMSSYMKKIPAYIISESTIGLMGAVECRKPSYADLGVTCSTL